MSLTRKQKGRYIDETGSYCPYCLSDDITTTEQVQIDGGSGWQNVMCNTCNSHWKDIYKLVDIEEDDE